MGLLQNEEPWQEVNEQRDTDRVGQSAPANQHLSLGRVVFQGTHTIVTELQPHKQMGKKFKH